MRSVMTRQWEDASEQTTRRHVRKERQAVTAVLDEIAPNQLHHLWKAIASKPLEPRNSSEEDDDVDNVLMEALTECYVNANRWDTNLVHNGKQSLISHPVEMDPQLIKISLYCY